MPQGITHLFIPGPTNVPDAVRRAGCRTALAAAEMGLTDTGAEIEPGTGVAAAQNYYRGESDR